MGQANRPNKCQECVENHGGYTGQVPLGCKLAPTML